MGEKEYCLKDYIEAMHVVNSYEKQLEARERSFAGICRCEKCNLKFGYTKEDLEVGKEAFRSGTYYYTGKCPYCNGETLLTSY